MWEARSEAARPSASSMSRSSPLATDERGVPPARAAAAIREHVQQEERRDGSGQALQLERLELLDLDGVPNETVRVLADQDRAAGAACSRRAATFTARPVDERLPGEPLRRRPRRC